MPRKRWVKLWTQESLYGSISQELEPEERWAWIGLLLLAGDSIEPGKVCAAPNIPWTDDQLAGILKIPKETWLSAKGKMLRHDKIRQNNDGILHIVNWEKYQGGFDKAEYMREYMSEYRKTGRKTNSKTNKSKINSKTSQSDQNRTEEEQKKNRAEEDKYTTPYSPPKRGKRRSELTKREQERFDRFWQAYPRKVQKGRAEKAFKKIAPDDDLVDSMIDKIEQAKRTRQWQEEGGRYIPHPATWLNARGWEDEYEELPQGQTGRRGRPEPHPPEDYKGEW